MSATVYIGIQKIIKITPSQKEQILDKTMLKLIESLAKDLNLDETKIYSINKFNKLLKRKRKTENTKISNELNSLTKDIIKKKTSVKRKALLNPWLFLKALYLYTISEV